MVSQKQFKAMQLRYKKPIVKEINYEFIVQSLWEIQEECEEVRWYCDSEDGEDTLLNSLDQNEDEAYEFKMAFADLCAEVDTMLSDIQDAYVPEYFNDFFVAIHGASVGGGLLGWDSYEQDYFGIDFYGYAEDESEKRIMRLSKKELLEAVGVCLKIYASFIGLQSRYENLKAAMDILREQNKAQLNVIKEISALHDDMQNKAYKYSERQKMNRKWNELLNALPQEAWLM